MANSSIQGLDELLRKFKDIGSLDNGKELRKAVKAGMTPVLETARRLAPVSKKPHRVYTGEVVRPGFGRKSLRIVAFVSRTKSTGIALLAPSKRAYYMTQFVELGTSRAAAHPFIRPALYSSAERARTGVSDSLRDYFIKRAAQP